MFVFLLLLFFSHKSPPTYSAKRKKMQNLPRVFSAHTQRFHHLSETFAGRFGDNVPHLRGELRNGILDRGQSFLDRRLFHTMADPCPTVRMFRKNPEKNPNHLTFVLQQKNVGKSSLVFQILPEVNGVWMVCFGVQSYRTRPNTVHLRRCLDV